MKSKQHSPINPMFKEEITREIMEHYEMNENEDTTYQNLLEESKSVLSLRER